MIRRDRSTWSRRNFDRCWSVKTSEATDLAHARCYLVETSAAVMKENSVVKFQLNCEYYLVNNYLVNNYLDVICDI